MKLQDMEDAPSEEENKLMVLDERLAECLRKRADESNQFNKQEGGIKGKESTQRNIWSVSLRQPPIRLRNCKSKE